MKPLSPANSYPKPTQSTQDYFPFGSLLPGRGVDQAEYKYGFNSKENDNEVYGDANFQDYGMRMYDTRVGRFVSVDPLLYNYPWNSPYAFCENDLIRAIDKDGLEKLIVIVQEYTDGTQSPQLTMNVEGVKEGVVTVMRRANGNIVVYATNEDGNMNPIAAVVQYNTQETECPFLKWIFDEEDAGGFHFYSKYGMDEESRKNRRKDAKSIDIEDVLNALKMPGKGRLGSMDADHNGKFISYYIRQVFKGLELIDKAIEADTKEKQSSGEFDIESQDGWHSRSIYDGTEDSMNQMNQYRREKSIKRIIVYPNED